MKNAAAIYLSKWPERSDTRRAMRNALKRLVGVLSDAEVDPEDFAWHELRYEDVRAVAAELADEEYSPPTINQALSALRGVLKAAWRSDMLPDDVYRKIEINSVAGDSERAGRALSPEEMSKLHASLSDAEPRDAAVMAVLAGTGVRRVELARLRGRDFESSTGRLAVRGKGNKHRQIPIGDRWIAYVRGWQSTLAKSDALMFDFATKHPRRAISYVVEQFYKKCGLESFTPHDLRRTFITHVEKVGGMALAKQLAGHSHMQTTALYVRVDEERERNSVKDL